MTSTNGTHREGAPSRAHTSRKLDGNAIAGALSQIFTFEPTTAEMCCASCGNVDVVACTDVYLSAMGAVVRCAQCTAVLLVIVELRGVLQFSAGGAAWVRAASVRS